MTFYIICHVILCRYVMTWGSFLEVKAWKVISDSLTATSLVLILFGLGGRGHILLGSFLRPLSFCTCIVAVSPPPVALSETVTLSDTVTLSETVALSDTVTDIPPLSELKMESESGGASNSSYGDKKPIKSTSKDRRSPQQGAKRRSRCQNCAGCLQKEDCGQCTTCK